jgi:predicted CoA-binding protein
MDHQNPSDDELRELLTSASVIAIVGASSSKERPSNGVMHNLLAAGYRVVPVNPNEREVLGRRAYASLAEIPFAVDIVNVFRRSEYTEAIAAEAVAVSARALWLQLGVINEAAATRAKAAGFIVVMDLCIAVEHSLLRIPKKGGDYKPA